MARGNRCLFPFHSEARLGVLIITSENTQSLLSPPPISQEISLLPKLHVNAAVIWINNSNQERIWNLHPRSQLPCFWDKIDLG